MFGKNKFSMQDTKKLINFLDVLNENESENDDKTMELICYGVELLYDKQITEFKPEERDKIMGETLTEINNAIGRYLKKQESKKNNDYVYITIDNKEFKSNPINIKIFYQINAMMLDNKKIFDIAEYVLMEIFNGILSLDKIDDIKENDYMYYEIIIDDVCNLIYKTIKAAMKITSYENPLKKDDKVFKNKLNDLSNRIDKQLEKYETDIYSIMLENYSILPEQVNKESASSILNLINSLKTSQIKREIREEIDKVKNNKDLSSKTKLEVLEQYLIELGGE